jgi:hypothetical protein
MVFLSLEIGPWQALGNSLDLKDYIAFRDQAKPLLPQSWSVIYAWWR